MALNKKKIKQKIIEELESVPVVLSICAKLGVSRATFYRWRKEDEEFMAQITDAEKKGRESIGELAESKLIQRIEKGERWAVKYWLENNHSKYIKPRSQYKRIDPIPPMTIKFIGARYDIDGNIIEDEGNDKEKGKD